MSALRSFSAHYLIGVDAFGEGCACGERRLHIVEHFADLALAELEAEAA